MYSLASTGDGGTAQILTLKQKGFDPMPRTAIALPSDLVERLDLLNVQKPFEISADEDYESDAAKSQTDMFTIGFRSDGREAPSSGIRMFAIAGASARSLIRSSAMDLLQDQQVTRWSSIPPITQVRLRKEIWKSRPSCRERLEQGLSRQMTVTNPELRKAV